MHNKSKESQKHHTYYPGLVQQCSQHARMMADFLSNTVQALTATSRVTCLVKVAQ